MTPSLSIPTDNPYKLMAIFGFVIFMLSQYFFIDQYSNSNDIIFKSAEKISHIGNQSDLPESVKQERIQIENKKIEIVVKNRNFLSFICGVIAAISCFISFIGFRYWILKIYPDEEAIRKEQLKSLQLSNKTLSRVRLNKRI
ncbi:hypothetical protein C0W59_07625 [Photobacterium kishitanii]|uniref:hypothetical protein n=1 Tax=Photobacterium kishitanii TaxID=318456 RepID=UPI000D155552|nr:hypothetical protein [Photobacterium kishitanii]PSV16548.1 hypothetical protein C0W59_07625 [Photobacterium kishitanii]